MEPCEYFLNTSPENKDCAYCKLLRINLDHNGNICKKCRDDKSFRKNLERQVTLRFGTDCGNPNWCEKFLVAVDEATCEKCKCDPEFRSFLFGQAQQKIKENIAKRKEGCANRKKVLKIEKRRCCGNETRENPVYECDLQGEVSLAKCMECENWQEVSDSVQN